MKRAEDLSTAELCEEVERLLAGTLSQRVLRYHTLAPELARRLRDRDAELREVRQALDVGPGEAIDGELVEAIEELQRQAARVAELEKIVALLKCDAGRGQAS